MKYELLAVLIVVVIIGGVYFLITSKRAVPTESEMFANGNEQIDDPLHQGAVFDPRQLAPPTRGAQMNPIKYNENVLPYPQISNNYAPQSGNVNGDFTIDTGKQPKLDCFPKDTITPQELMPKEDSYNTWQASSPPVNGHLADRNFLESGHHFGIDTVSNTMKNPNLQLRSDPLIPQKEVGPWMQSTFGPDTNHRQLEIGGDY